MTPAIDFRLYLVTNRHLCAPRALRSVVQAACDAGVRAVQLREKDLSGAAIDALVEELHPVVTAAGATLFVNQSHPSAIASGAGMHFPESLAPSGEFHFPESAPISQTGSRVLIGVSTHSPESASAAARAGADFITFGPVYETPAKMKHGPPQGVERLREATAAVDVPVFAIGGVTPERVRHCLDAGAHGVAVMGAIMAANDTAAAVRAFEKELGGL